MQRSFSVVHDDNLVDDQMDEIEKFDLGQEFPDSDLEDVSRASPKKLPPQKKPEALPRRKSSAGPSATKSLHSSDSDDSEADRKPNKIPGEYDPAEFDELVVDPETAEIFQYIAKYTPQSMAMEYKFKPFIPEFLPAVGDIDAFLKVVPPDTSISGEIFDESILQLGLLVLDEPASNQSDPALLHLQLRAAHDSMNIGQGEQNIVVKKIDNVEKNTKVIDKWVKDIAHLHKSKSSPVVKYSQPMPDIDDLMQQWPEDLEQKFKEEGFPKPKPDQSLSSYVDIVCNYLQIPIGKNKIQSIHLLFCLYTAIKQTQLYQAQALVINEKKKKESEDEVNKTADQLVLD